MHQAVLGWFLVGILFGIKYLPGLSPTIQRILLMVFSLFLASRYWVFRTFDTLYYTAIIDCAAMILLYLAESYGILIHVTGMFVNILPLKRKLRSIDLNRPDLPTIDIFIPTYNEPVKFVEITATACLSMEYPKDKVAIHILDDGGTWEKKNDKDPVKAEKARNRANALGDAAQRLGIRYLTRKNNKNAKAGNITAALKATAALQASSDKTLPVGGAQGQKSSGGELIVVLDCDHIPTTDFLKNTVGYFLEDEKLFLVQTPHFMINPDPLEKNLGTHAENPGENEMFYGAVQLGMDFWNSSFFCGSAALLRRRCLEEIGGIAADTVTEDAETSLLLHAKGYNSVYIDHPMVCGMAPETVNDFIGQRSRWTQGMIQIFMLKNPLFMKGLKLYQRISYFNSCVFWFFGIARFIFLLAPLAYLYFGLKVYNASLPQILAYTVPHLVGVVIVTDYLFGRVRHPFFSELYESMQSIFLLPAIIGAIVRPKIGKFKVTPKGKRLNEDFLSPLAFPFYLLLVINFAAIPAAVYRWYYMPLSRDTIIICSFWVFFNLVLVLLCLGIAWERRQIRTQHRITINEDVTVRIEANQQEIQGRIVDISLAGFRFIPTVEAAIKEGDYLTILAQSSTNESLAIQAETLRITKQGGDILWGCSFDLEDQEARRDIINFVYGSSSRWQRFWSNRRAQRISIIAGFFYLLQKGINGTARNLKGVAITLLYYIQRSGIHLWNGIKWHMQKVFA